MIVFAEDLGNDAPRVVRMPIVTGRVKMDEYIITMPIKGRATIGVTASSKEEAIEIAANQITFDEIEEWSVQDQDAKASILK